MPRKLKNRVIAAAEREEDDVPAVVRAAENHEFDVDAPDEMTDDEVREQVANMPAASRARVLRSRQPGRLPSRGHKVRKGTAARVKAARQPRRGEEFDWTPANTLDAPPPLPGMEQRWIRVKLDGKDDPEHLSKKVCECW